MQLFQKEGLNPCKCWGAAPWLHAGYSGGPDSPARSWGGHLDRDPCQGTAAAVQGWGQNLGEMEFFPGRLGQAFCWDAAVGEGAIRLQPYRRITKGLHHLCSVEPPTCLIKPLLAEMSKAQSPHLGVISPSASPPATLPDAPYLLSPPPETQRAAPAPPAGGRDGCPRRDSLPAISAALICRREWWCSPCLKVKRISGRASAVKVGGGEAGRDRALPLRPTWTNSPGSAYPHLFSNIINYIWIIITHSSQSESQTAIS